MAEKSPWGMRTQNAGIRKVGVTNNGETHGSREKGWLELKKPMIINRECRGQRNFNNFNKRSRIEKRIARQKELDYDHQKQNYYTSLHNY